MKKILFSLLLFFITLNVIAQIDSLPSIIKGQQKTYNYGYDTIPAWIVRNNNTSGSVGFVISNSINKAMLYMSRDTTILKSENQLYIPNFLADVMKWKDGSGQAGKVLMSDNNGNLTLQPVGSGSVGNADSLDGENGLFYRDTIYIKYCSCPQTIDKWIGQGDTLFVDTSSTGGSSLVNGSSIGQLLNWNGTIWDTIPFSNLQYTNDSLRGNIVGASGGASIDTTSLSNRINLKRDLSNVDFDSIQVNYISPKDSASFEIHNHSNSSLITFEDGQRHIGSINGYFGTYKGLDVNAGNYYKNGLWYRSTIYKPLCFFENLNAGTFEFWSEDAGTINSSITWTSRKAYINSVGSFYGYDLHASNSLYVTDSIVNTALTNNLNSLSDTANVALLATPNTFTKANTFNSSVILPNAVATTTAPSILVLENNVIKKDVLIDINQSTLEKISTDTLTANFPITFGGLSSFIGVQVLVDDGSIVLPSGVAGFGTIQIGDNQEYARFNFTSAGVVSLLENSTNVVNTDTDTKLCVFDSGTTVTIRNRLGAQLKLRYTIYYSIN